MYLYFSSNIPLQAITARRRVEAASAQATQIEDPVWLQRTSLRRELEASPLGGSKRSCHSLLPKQEQPSWVPVKAAFRRPAPASPIWGFASLRERLYARSCFDLRRVAWSVWRPVQTGVQCVHRAKGPAGVLAVASQEDRSAWTWCLTPTPTPDSRAMKSLNPFADGLAVACLPLEIQRQPGTGMSRRVRWVSSADSPPPSLRLSEWTRRSPIRTPAPCRCSCEPWDCNFFEFGCLQ